MKKTLTAFLLTALASTALAEEANKKTPQTEAAKQAKVIYQIFDANSKVAKPVEGNKLSISKNHQFCWTAIDMKFEPNNTLIEEIIAPEGSNFASPGSNVLSANENGRKVFRITTHNAQASNNEFIRRCWKFDKADPKGKYVFGTIVNKTGFAPFEFEIVE